MTDTLDEKVERFLYDLGGWSVGAVTERRRERLYALLDDARDDILDIERLGKALHRVYCQNNYPMHSHPHHSADAIIREYNKKQ